VVVKHNKLKILIDVNMDEELFKSFDTTEGDKNEALQRQNKILSNMEREGFMVRYSFSYDKKTDLWEYCKNCNAYHLKEQDENQPP
jgi:hypothetical protein